MPQVDMSDLPSLMAFLNTKKAITISEVMVPPSWLVPRQCLEGITGCKRVEVLAKPLLIAVDLSILDGYHRWVRHKEVADYRLQQGAAEPYLIRCYQINREFEEAKKAIFDYPKTYHEAAFASERY